ncbi:MAG: hypothetical protein IJ111_07520 [Eggerthellaceae bacterium]|nr:hypothetical protein [Eggerthellaceae bacterium]
MANTRSQITESPRAKRTARLAAALALALTLALALVGCTVSKPSSFADATVEEGYVVISKADIGPKRCSSTTTPTA